MFDSRSTALWPVNPFSTHILDTTRGRPAAGVPVTLERRDGAAWASLGGGNTDDDGRLAGFAGDIGAGTYRVTFDTGAYFAALGTEGFYPSVSIEFSVRADDEHYHVPLLLNPFGYSTYRGS